MVRGKLALELISKERTRKVTFERRKKGLIKKAREFSILCGVDTYVIIYGTPAITDCPEEPEVWPADHEEVERIIQRYMSEGIGRRTTRSVGLPGLSIGQEKMRKVTFEKRKKGLINKAREISILCGVDTCVIIYGTPAITDRPEEPEVWPADRGKVERIIQRYMSEGVDRAHEAVGWVAGLVH